MYQRNISSSSKYISPRTSKPDVGACRCGDGVFRCAITMFMLSGRLSATMLNSDCNAMLCGLNVGVSKMSNRILGRGCVSLIGSSRLECVPRAAIVRNVSGTPRCDLSWLTTRFKLCCGFPPWQSHTVPSSLMRCSASAKVTQVAEQRCPLHQRR